MAKILVVDDNAEVRDFLVDYVLRPAGHQVVTADEGAAGYSAARAHSPDLIIADMQMPRMTGLEMLRALHKDQYYVPFILMTSEGSEQLAAEALRAGASGYVTKPFEPEQMLSNVEQSLALVRMRQEHAAALEEVKSVNQRLEQRLRQLEVIERVGRSVTASLEVDLVLSEVVSAAVQLANAEEGSLLLLEPGTGELVMRAAKNFDDEFVRTFRLRSEDSLAGHVIRTGEPYLLGQDAPHKIKTTYLVRSLVYVPLKVKGQTIGVLGVDNRRQDRHFTKGDIPLLQALADYAAVAIENARLFEHTEDERKKLDAILTQTGDGVIVTDESNRLILMNETARSAFGLNAKDINGVPLDKIIPNEELRDLFVSTAHERCDQRAEVVLDDGRVLNAHLTAIDGVGQAAILQDITHLKELDRIKSEFVSTVSHDLRSPLTAILGYVDLIPRSGPVTPQQQEFINRVKFSVNSISALITDLLDLGRIEQGFDTRKEDVDLPLICRYAVEGLMGRAEAKGQTLEVDLSRTTDPVHGNPIRLRQMAANLIDNAIKYTPEGGRVSISLQQTANQLILTVSDTGIGIPPAEQPHVFDKFFRSEVVEEDEGTVGTGLGLSIVKSIVENHDGRIWLESKVGRGTTFTVVLPTAGHASNQ